MRTRQGGRGRPMRSFGRLTVPVLILGVMMLAAAVSPRLGQAEDVLHVGIVNSSTDVSFFIADANGYFGDEGLQVDFVPFDAAAKMVPALGTGELAAGS